MHCYSVNRVFELTLQYVWPSCQKQIKNGDRDERILQTGRVSRVFRSTFSCNCLLHRILFSSLFLISYHPNGDLTHDSQCAANLKKLLSYLTSYFWQNCGILHHVVKPASKLHTESTFHMRRVSASYCMSSMRQPRLNKAQQACQTQNI